MRNQPLYLAIILWLRNLKRNKETEKTRTTTALVKEHEYERVLTKPLDICPKSF